MPIFRKACINGARLPAAHTALPTTADALATDAKAVVAAGADALLIEVHPCPSEAWCDADQALTPDEFAALMDKLDALAQALGRRIDRHAAKEESAALAR